MKCLILCFHDEPLSLFHLSLSCIHLFELSLAMSILHLFQFPSQEKQVSMIGQNLELDFSKVIVIFHWESHASKGVKCSKEGVKINEETK